MPLSYGRLASEAAVV